MIDISIVDLAHTADFRLGDVLVRPPLRQVVQDGGKSEILQPRVMEVLVFLAGARGAVVTREELTSACWRGRVVGEDAINRVILQLRRLAMTFGENAFRIETIPKVGYRMDCPAQGLATSGADTFPVARVSPAQPAEPKRESVTSVRSPWRVSRVLVPAAAAFVLLLGAGIGLWGSHFEWPWSASRGPRVAVAPFEVIGGGADAPKIAKAVASDAVSALGANTVQTIAVPSVASAPSSAHLVLNGDVQQIGANARVTLHVFDSDARAILWSGEVAGDPENLAERASLKAADMLTCGLKGFASKTRLDAQARVLWLRACDTWRQRETLGQARDALGILMQRAPKFAEAYARYALATVRMIPYGLPSAAPAARTEARGEALHALRLDPREADAYVALSLTEPATDWFSRERWLLAGLARQPNDSDLISWEGDLLSMVGRTGEALALARRGLELDPHSAVKTVDLAASLYLVGETSEATKVEELARSTWPQSPDVLSLEFEHAVRSGSVSAVLGRLSSPRTRPVDMSDEEARLWPKIMVATRASSGVRAALAKQVGDFVERGRFDDFFGFLALRLLNEDNAAYDLMVRLSSGANNIVSPEDVATVLFQPEMADIRRQPRFVTLAASLGLTKYWLRSRHWPDFCSDPGVFTVAVCAPGKTG